MPALRNGRFCYGRYHLAASLCNTLIRTRLYCIYFCQSSAIFFRVNLCRCFSREVLVPFCGSIVTYTYYSLLSYLSLDYHWINYWTYIILWFILFSFPEMKGLFSEHLSEIYIFKKWEMYNLHFIKKKFFIKIIIQSWFCKNINLTICFRKFHYNIIILLF